MTDWRWFYKVRLRLRTLLRRDQVERELDEEFRYHLDQRMEQEIARGLAREDARRVAVRAMEGVEQKKEECRDMRRVNFIEALLQDLRYALRTLARSPGFTAAAVIALALGIGGSSAIFSVVEGVALRPLAAPQSDQLVRLYETIPGTAPNSAAPNSNRNPYSIPDYLDLAKENGAFESTSRPRASVEAAVEISKTRPITMVCTRRPDSPPRAARAAGMAFIAAPLWRRRWPPGRRRSR